MAAQNTQGVGNGSAEGNQKGNARMTLGSDHLIGTRVVLSGSTNLVSGTPSTAVVTFPVALTDAATNYMVIATAQGATAAIAAGGVAVSGLSTTGFTLTGPNSVTTTINWALIKVSNA